MKSAWYPLAFVCTVTLFSHAALADDEAAIEHGRYLANAADCGACHTVDENKPFAGGLKIASPVGNIYSTNITPDKKTGIGDYSYEDFSRAVRDGIAKDGSVLYPAMPYPSYSRLTDDDVRDLYAYFHNSVQPQQQPNRKTDIPWPLNMRWPLHLWKWAFVSDPAHKPPMKDPQWARGAYLVQSLGHCGACHTPRGVAFQEKALDQTDSDYLTGGKIDNWFAPDLTGSKVTGLGDWSQQDIVDFLDTGKNARTIAFGPMKEVITKSTHQMTDDDLNAIAIYLKTLRAKNNDPTLKDDPSTAHALTTGDVSATGAKNYVDNCSACHRSDGKGYPNIFPPLAHNTAILSDDPSSVINIILSGGAQPVTESDVTGIVMPDFADQLNNKQIADVATFIRNSWGNHAPPVTESDVKNARENLMKTKTQ
ncbi:c-type cytochrome [Scandinavium sp. NPDC088450]|uniref:c-type cytochrome n=1 Tax=Scandinavium sp. NPDC088450 TaxID=3364514 RepID=UPI003850324C